MVFLYICMDRVITTITTNNSNSSFYFIFFDENLFSEGLVTFLLKNLLDTKYSINLFADINYWGQRIKFYIISSPKLTQLYFTTLVVLYLLIY